MKKFFSIMMSMALAIITFASCDDPNYSTQKDDNVSTGELSTAGLSVDVVNPEGKAIETRSGSDVNTFTVHITGTDYDQSYVYGKLPEILVLPVGDYTLEVFNEEPKEADWESPYYYAATTFSIKKGEVTDLGNVVCTLQNIKVSIRYSEQLQSLMGTDVKVKVEVANRNSLEFAYNETRSGFFKYYDTNKTLVATFSGTVDGSFVSNYKVLTDVAPGQHRIITFSAKTTPAPDDESGTIGTTGLSLDANVTVVDMTVDVPAEEGTIDPFEDLKVNPASLSFKAGGETKSLAVTAAEAWTAASSESWLTIPVASGTGDGSINVTAAANEAETSRTATVTVTMGNVKKTINVTQAGKVTADESAPSITSTTVDLQGSNVVTGESKVDVDVTAPNGIKNFNVEIISNDLTPDVLAGVGLAAKFDLCNPGSLDEALKGLGFPTGDEVRNKTSLKFDISNFMGVLTIYKGTHKFVLNVVDNKGLETTETLTLVVE